jgi:DNA-binding response OmpR family regulator
MTLIEVAEARHLGIRLIEQPQNRSSGSTAPGTPVVLVLEPEETLAGLLEVALSYAGFTVEIASDYARALEAFDRRRPTLMILDVETPGNAGMTLLQTLRARSDVPIILLTAPGATEDRVAGLNIGADDCLTKPFRFEELTARMQSVLRRHRITLVKTLVVGSLELDRGSREVTDGGRPLKLTPREFDLLEYFMLNPRQVLTRETIVNRVWGYDAELATNVVDVYVRYLRTKLGDAQLERITSIRGLGYALYG